jgi:hypothetical protein
MATVTEENALAKVGLRKAAGMINAASRVFLGLLPALLTVRLTKKAARRLLADLKAKGQRRVMLRVTADPATVGFLVEGRS